tara:strand:+ start:136 stop:537 length:402 start_codon:yes stop_codon:yes gene_type:complete
MPDPIVGLINIFTSLASQSSHEYARKEIIKFPSCELLPKLSQSSTIKPSFTNTVLDPSNGKVMGIFLSRKPSTAFPKKTSNSVSFPSVIGLRTCPRPLTSRNFASGRDIFCFGNETAVAELLELSSDVSSVSC